eukprot:c23789_g11_i2 orf=70-312(+)
MRLQGWAMLQWTCMPSVVLFQRRDKCSMGRLLGMSSLGVHQLQDVHKKVVLSKHTTSLKRCIMQNEGIHPNAMTCVCVLN